MSTRHFADPSMNTNIRKDRGTRDSERVATIEHRLSPNQKVWVRIPVPVRIVPAKTQVSS